MRDLKGLDLIPLTNALASLREALQRPPLNDLERDGTIQRFEYTFELCWKSIQKALVALGRADVSGSPKPIFRDALREGWIDKVEPWFGFLEARNATTHIYHKTVAERVYASAKDFLPFAEQLLKKLTTVVAS